MNHQEIWTEFRNAETYITAMKECDTLEAQKELLGEAAKAIRRARELVDEGTDERPSS